MLTRSANASPSIHGFHYAPSRSPRPSTSRISAAAASSGAAPAPVRRPSSSSPSHQLVSSTAAPACSIAGLSPALLHLQPPTPLHTVSSSSSTTASPPSSPSSLRSLRRYVSVDAATQYSPTDQFDYASHPTRAQPPPPSSSPRPAGPSSASHIISKQSTPRELPPKHQPILMEPGIEQGVGPGNGHVEHQQGSLATDAPTTTSAPESAPASAPTPVPTINNPPPSTPSSAQPQQQQPHQQLQQPVASSPQKRRKSQANEPIAQAGGNGESSPVQSGVTATAPSAPSVDPSSPTTAKRARPDVAPPKMLPELYEHCAVEDMVVLIANMLGELIETNDALAFKSGHLTRFHSRTPPGISVLDYLHRLAKHATLTPPLLLSMVYYIDRLCAMYPDFTINTLTVHRFLITAATVAAKGLSDSFWNNSTYARVGGVRVAELKMLELEFLYRLEWKIVPNPEVLAAYYRPLVERCLGYALPPDNSSPSRDEDASSSDNEMDNDGDRHERAGNSGHNRQSSTSLVGEDLVVSGLTGR